jgi:hypothetical protein
MRAFATVRSNKGVHVARPRPTPRGRLGFLGGPGSLAQRRARLSGIPVVRMFLAITVEVQGSIPGATNFRQLSADPRRSRIQS